MTPSITLLEFCPVTFLTETCSPTWDQNGKGRLLD